MEICPRCNYKETKCDWKDCDSLALYEGYVEKRGSLTWIVRMQLCKEHVKESIGYKQGGEKALRNAKPPRRK